MHPLGNDHNRHGSAAFATDEEMSNAGLFYQTPDALFAGFSGRRKLWINGPGGVLIAAGARGGKLTGILGYNICTGVLTNNTLMLDPKGEGGYISQNQTADNKYCYYFHPVQQHGIIQHRLNPVDYLHINNPVLVSNMKVFCLNKIPLSAEGSSGRYFEQRGQDFLEAIALTIVEIDGVLTLPRLYHFINLIPGDSDEWMDFQVEMSLSRFEVARRVADEINDFRDSTGNTFQSILGEVFKAVSCLSDPMLMDAVSPPYDFSMKDLCESDRAIQVYIMPPAEFLSAWAPVIKDIFVAGMIYKSHAPQARRQTWILDECAQLGNFPLISQLFSYGAGIGIRPVGVYQNVQQMKATGPNADADIMASAETRLFFAVRDIETASVISRMLGEETLLYDDERQQAQAEFAKRQAAQAMFNGADPFEAGLRYGHYKEAASMKSVMRRPLRTPSEVLNMSGDKMFLFTDAVRNPIYADRRPYFEQEWMAGRYHPNPFHPPLDKVRVKTWLGKSWRNVRVEPVPDKYSDFPQYAHGYWSRIED